jgi:DUF971 family protein
MDIPLSSYIWKCVVGEPLSVVDIKSFDVSAWNFVQLLDSLSSRIKVLQAQELINVNPNTSFDIDESNRRDNGRNSSIKVAYSGSSLILGALSLIPTSGHKKNIKAGLESGLGLKLESGLTDGDLSCLPFPSSTFLPRSPRLLSSSLPLSSHKDSNKNTNIPATSASFITPFKNANPNPNSDLKSNIKNDLLDSLLLEIEAIIIDLDWTYLRSDGRVVELVVNGSKKPVFINDVDRYLMLYIEARLQEGEKAIESFRSGLASVVPESAFILYNSEEMERIVCGNRMIDITRLRDNTEYDNDISLKDPHIIYFWEILEEFNELEKTLFLRFVWARTTLPPKGVKFQKMKIQSASGSG